MTATSSISLSCSSPTARPASGSLWRAPLVMMFIILATFVLGPVQSAHASADETQFLALVNVERVSRGLPALNLQPVISDNVSRPWSVQMAATGRLEHSGSGQQILDSVARFYPTTTSVGENVGYAGSVVELHAALMASTPHRANILSGTFRSVGFGVVQANGQVWVTQTFFAVSNKAAPAPAQPAPAKPVAAPAAPKPAAAAPKPVAVRPAAAAPKAAAVRPAAAAPKPAAVRPAAAPKPAAVKPATVLVAPAAAPPPAVSGQAANVPSPVPTAVDEVADLAAPFLVDSGKRVTPAGAVASALALCLALAVRRQLRFARD